MAETGRKLTAAVEEYLAELRRIRSTGAAPANCPTIHRCPIC